MKGPVLGVSVSEGRVCGMLLSGVDVVWRALETDADTGVAISRLIEALPVSMRPSSVRVGLGHPFVRTRQISGLPPDLGGDSRTHFVAEHLRHFFITSDRLTGPSRVISTAHGATWGALYDADVLRAIVRPIGTAGLAVEAVLPAPFALTAVSVDGTHDWHDGVRLLQARVVEGTLIALAVVENAPSFDGGFLLTEFRSQIHSEEEAVALGAAMVGLNQVPFALDVDPEAAVAHSLRSERAVRLAAGTLVGSVALGLFLPMMVAFIAAAGARRDIAEVSVARRESIELSQALTRESRVLSDMHALSSRRRSRVADLAALTRLLPDSCAISAAQFDSGSVELVLMAPSIADVVRTLDQAPEVAGLSIIGAITAAAIPQAKVERATVRFRLLNAVSADRRTGSARSGE